MANDKLSNRNKWVQLLKQSVESDSWGQPIEALASYEKLNNLLLAELNGSQISDEERGIIAKGRLCLGLRIKALRGSTDNFPFEELQKLDPVFKALAEGKPIPSFPINLSKFKTDMGEEDIVAASSPVVSPMKGGTLLPPPPSALDGGVHLSIYIEKIGLKTAVQYLDPFISISVLDKNGELLESTQETPCSNQKKENYIYFGCNVEIQTNINKLPEGSAIVFEFKHFKPKGEYISTKGWSFLELDEIKAGPAVLEIYQKPTDKLRKRLRLLSVKPLYFHLNLKETVL